MKSLEALEKISWRYVNDPQFQEWCSTIKQDLERKEQLEKENQELKEQLRIDEVLSDAFEKQSFEAVKDLDTFKLAFYTMWKCCNNMHTHTDIPDTDTYMEFRLGHESVYIPVTKEEVQAVADACDLLDLEYMEGE